MPFGIYKVLDHYDSLIELINQEAVYRVVPGFARVC